MSNDEESWLAGRRAAYNSLLAVCVRELGYENGMQACGAEREWRPIETAPDSKMVLVATGGCVQIARRFGGVWKLPRKGKGGAIAKTKQPTHWQPIPELPSMNGGNYKMDPIFPIIDRGIEG